MKEELPFAHTAKKIFLSATKPWPVVWRSLTCEKPSQALCWVFCQSNRFSTSPRPVWSRQGVAMTIPHWYTRFPCWTWVPLWPDLVWLCCSMRWVADALTGRVERALHMDKILHKALLIRKKTNSLLNWLSRPGSSMGVFFRYWLQKSYRWGMSPPWWLRQTDTCRNLLLLSYCTFIAQDYSNASKSQCKKTQF